MYNQINSLQFRQFILDLAKQPAVTVCRKHLQNIREILHLSYANARVDHPRIATQLVEGFAFDIDTIVLTLWRENRLHLVDDLSLIATGGYGRMQLHPFSDVDLLVLHQQHSINNNVAEQIAAFVRGLWDCGLQIGSSIRSMAAAKSDIAHDVILLTSLLESRQLGGKIQLHVELLNAVYARVYNNRYFFKNKLKEQQQRHAKFDNVSTLIEPNIKNSPGALRDLHSIFWLSQVTVRGLTPEKLLEAELISHAGMHQLIRARNLLISVRLGLHLLAGKPEERLLVDYQRELATQLGYKKTNKTSVEEFMQRVYKALLVVSAINDLICVTLQQSFAPKRRIREIDQNFYAIGNTLMCYNTDCFRLNPSNLLLCFKFLAQNPNLKQLSGECISAIYENSLLIDDSFRHNPLNKQYFMDIISARCDVSVILEQMKRFGVLGRYLQVFGAIIGQLQHDLVHVFTVDAHSIRVLHNMYNLLQPANKEDDNLRIPAQVANQLPEFPILLIAGLFHDVAKGRGGNHSQLGAIDVKQFARTHMMPDWQVDLLGWLVAEHLSMSAVAQHKDIDDPQIIEKFAAAIGDKLHLDYLYVLTVTDIMSTNPKLWNAWRAALLTKLYQNSLSWLNARENFSNLLVNSRKDLALERIPARMQKATKDLWQQLPADFFQSKSATNLVLHSTKMVRHLNRQMRPETCQVQTAKQLKVDGFKREQVMLLLRPTHNLISFGATEISIFCRSSSGLFSRITAALYAANVNVVEARVFGLKQAQVGYSLISCILLGEDNKPIAKRHYGELRQMVHTHLACQQTPDKKPLSPNQLLSPRVKKFWFAPEITITRNSNQLILRVKCIDFPGLLALIVASLHQYSIQIERASITTLGDSARDTFVITPEDPKDTIQPQTANQLVKALHQTLTRQVNKDA